MQGSGGSRPSAKEGLIFKGLTMNVKFCENNSGTSKKMRYFQKNKVGAWGPWPFLWIRQSATARETNTGSKSGFYCKQALAGIIRLRYFYH